jgi:hypothetical protein
MPNAESPSDIRRENITGILLFTQNDGLLYRKKLTSECLWFVFTAP